MNIPTPSSPINSYSTWPAAPTAPTTTSDHGAAYHLLTVYSEPEKSPGAFRKATAFAIDRTGTVYLYDDHAQRILVYR